MPWQPYRPLVGTGPTPEPAPTPTPPADDCAQQLSRAIAVRDSWRGTAEACDADRTKYRDEIIPLTTQRDAAMTECAEWQYRAEEAEKRWNAIPKWIRGMLRVL